MLSSNEANEVVQLVVSCELSSLPNLALIALADANEYEYVAVAAVELVAQSSTGSGGHALTERTGRQVNTGGLGTVGMGREVVCG